MSLKLLRKIPIWEISLVTLFFFTGYGISTYNQSSQVEDSPPNLLDESYNISDNDSDDFGELGKLTLQELGSAVVAADVNSDLELLELIKSESSLKEKAKKSKLKSSKKPHPFTQLDKKMPPLSSKSEAISLKEADRKTIEEAKPSSTTPKAPNQPLNPEAALLATPLPKAKPNSSKEEKLNKKTAFSKIDSKKRSSVSRPDSILSKPFDPEDSLQAIYSASPDVSLDPISEASEAFSTPEELLSALYINDQTFASYTPPVPSQPTSGPFSLPSDPTEPPLPKANKSARKKSLGKKVSYKPEEIKTEPQDSAEVAYLDHSTQWIANADSQPSDGDWIYDGSYDASDWMAYKSQVQDNSSMHNLEPASKKPVSDFIGESTSIHSSLQVFAHQDNIINPPTPSSDSSTDTLDPWDERRIINTDHISQYNPPSAQSMRSQNVNDSYESRELEPLQPQQQAWSQTATQQPNWPQEAPQQAWTESAQQAWPQEQPQQPNWQRATAPMVEHPSIDEPLPPFLRDQSIQPPSVSSHPMPSAPVVGYPARPVAPLPPPPCRARGPYPPPPRPMGWRAPPPPRPLPPPGAYGPMRPAPYCRPPMPLRPYPPYGVAPRPMGPPQPRTIAPVSAPLARPAPMPNNNNRSHEYFM